MKSVMNRRFTFEGRVAVPEAKRAVRLHFEAPAHRSDEKKIVLAAGDATPATNVVAVWRERMSRCRS